MRSIKWWQSRFPEDLYPAKASDYTERVLTGFEIASRSSCTIAGLCRNGEAYLPEILNRVEKLASYFFETQVCVLENDSTDRTSEILSRWSHETELENYVLCKRLDKPKFGSVRTKERIEQMSFLRTELQKIVLSIEKTDYVILLDLDINSFSYDGILNSLTYEFDVMASNGLVYAQVEDKKVRMYYDSYGSKFEPEKTEEEKNRLVFHRGEKPVKCLSAFGGLAIYKWRPYAQGEYGITDWMQYCEHIKFHQNMNCLINPSQIVLYNKTGYSI